jgi:hypothetical protein
MENLNIAHLIERNSITRLSKDYENKFLMKIKENFNDKQQQLFVASFYCFLNYDSKKDFVIDFDNVWKWLGFSRKDPAKRLLDKYFTKDVDYKILLHRSVENKNKEETRGRKEEQIILTINTFKKFCLKAETKKADEVHDYYIKLEELLQETVNEETNELRLQLDNKEQEKMKIEQEMLRIEEENKILIRKYVKKTKEIIDSKNVVYLMTTDEGEIKREYVVGKSIDLDHRKNTYDHNKLHDFKVVYYVSCKDTKLMDILEPTVLMKLEKYRCKAGRDVFLLPESADITLFTNIYDECFNFYKDVDEILYPKRTIYEDKDSNRERKLKYREENKEKVRESAKEYYENNKEILSEEHKFYYQKNFEVISEKAKQHYQENKEEMKKDVMEYYNKNKEDILEKRKEFYEDNKEIILEERHKYYKENYKTKIKEQRTKKETCECGMIVTHYCMKNHKKTDRHRRLMEKLDKEKSEIIEEECEEEYVEYEGEEEENEDEEVEVEI